MPQPTHILVTAMPGREAPFAAGEASAPRAKAGKVYRVAYSTSTRKRITSGDLALVNRHGQRVTELEHANAPDDIEIDETGALAGVTVVTTEGTVDPIVTADAPARDRVRDVRLPPRKE